MSTALPAHLKYFAALPFPIYNEKTLVSVSSEESFRDHESIETAEVQELVGPPYHIVGKVPHDCGPHGDILTAVRTDDHGNVVLKKLRVPHMDEDSARTSWALIELIFRLSQGFAHSNIGSILGLDKSGTLGTLPVLTLPLYVLGNVMQYTKDNISASKLALMTQACCGLAYLHSVILHHGNVTPPNILINDKGQAVLCDWGIGLALHPLWSPYNHVSTSWPRTAPEVIADFNSSSAADVFSFSLSVYEVFMGCLPHAKKPYGRGVVNMMKYGITLDKPMAINSAICFKNAPAAPQHCVYMTPHVAVIVNDLTVELSTNDPDTATWVSFLTHPCDASARPIVYKFSSAHLDSASSLVGHHPSLATASMAATFSNAPLTSHGR
ncbi:kinase-like protein [Rickenella mellea]|uniref:Kinase-like protein n=1 Tax=Rickenella mellea TaxID=50990 RepID=A0A4Y7Q7Q0_9AGAM|nr:kinase-like protein [Rickenella mellea]